MIGCHGQHALERFQAALVFFGGAHRNADPLRQLVAAHRPHNDSKFLQLVENALAIADADQNEVGLGGNEFQSQLAKCAYEGPQTPGVIPAGFLNMPGVIEGGQRAGLRDGIDVERLPNFFQVGNEVGVTDAITEPQPGQPVDL